MWRSPGLWVLQRITAAVLVLLLGLHVWASNFATEWAAQFRLIVDFALLAIALFHGLNGVRTIVLDFGIGEQGRQFLSVSLTVLGLVAFLFGVYGLWPLLLSG